MDSRLREAERLARVILEWHQAFGRRKIQEVAPEFYNDYLKRLDSLCKLDLTKPENLRRVANEQVMGIFERFYAEPIPQTLWDEFIQSIVNLNKPRNLGSVGHLILQLLEDYEQEPEAVAAFLLPDRWVDQPILLQPGYARLPVSPDKTPRAALRDYFSNLSRFEDLGIGGRELMVAMNEDLYEGRGILEGYITVYNPASFNFQLATGEGKLVTQAIHGEITISEVLLGCDPDYEKEHKE